MKKENAFILGLVIGVVFSALMTGYMMHDKSYQDIIFQVIYGRSLDPSKVAITIVPNPWPGHTNVFYVNGLNIGALQINIHKNGAIDFFHKELYNVDPSTPN